MRTLVLAFKGLPAGIDDVPDLIISSCAVAAGFVKMAASMIERSFCVVEVGAFIFAVVDLGSPLTLVLVVVGVVEIVFRVAAFAVVVTTVVLCFFAAIVEVGIVVVGIGVDFTLPDVLPAAFGVEVIEIGAFVVVVVAVGEVRVTIVEVDNLEVEVAEVDEVVFPIEPLVTRLFLPYMSFSFA